MLIALELSGLQSLALPVRARVFGLLLEVLTQYDADYLASHAAPSLAASGVRYQTEPLERFSSIPDVLRRGFGDCEDLVCWRAAELRRAGIQARAVLVPQSANFLHAVLEYPDGKRDDVARRYGMP